MRMRSLMMAMLGLAMLLPSTKADDSPIPGQIFNHSLDQTLVIWRSVGTNGGQLYRTLGPGKATPPAEDWDYVCHLDYFVIDWSATPTPDSHIPWTKVHAFKVHYAGDEMTYTDEYDNDYPVPRFYHYVTTYGVMLTVEELPLYCEEPTDWNPAWPSIYTPMPLESAINTYIDPNSGSGSGPGGGDPNGGGTGGGPGGGGPGGP